MAEPTLTKEQTVSELFALRAGLSQISAYTNEIAGEENAISDRRAYEFERKRVHEQTVQNICNEEVETESQAAEKIEQIRDDAWSLGDLGLSADSADFGEFSEVTVEEAKTSIENSVNPVEKPKKVFSILFILFWIMAIVGNPITIIIEIVICVTVDGIKQIMWILIPLSVFSMIMIGILVACDKEAKSIDYFYNKKKYEKYVDDACVRDIKLENLKKWYAQAKVAKIAEYEKTIKEAQNKRDDALAAEEKRFNAERAELTEKDEKADEVSREKIRLLAAQSANIDKIMTAKYPWVAKSDWGNTDMLIYYMQTGRADTLKEALYHVDRQLQSEQIVKAVNDSAAYVSQTINKTLNRNFYELSRVVKSSAYSIGAEISSVVGKARFIERKLARRRRQGVCGERFETRQAAGGNVGRTA